MASSSPASQVGLARLSAWPVLSSRISGASASSALRALTTAGSGSYSTSISPSASRADVLVGRDHERDLLALEADLVAREDGLGVVGDRGHPREAERLEVLGGDDRGHTRVGERPARVDRQDARVRVRAAQHGAVHHPRQPDVVQVGALAADEPRVLLALQPAEADRPFVRRAGEVLDDGHAHTSCSCGGLVLGGPLHRGDDVLVARAPADPAGDRGTDLLVGRVRVLVEERAARHQHPRSAEPALERVHLVEALLDRVEDAVTLERLDRPDLVALAHHGERGARLDRLPVHQHDARAAVGRVAAPVRAGQPGRVADEVDQQLARLHVARDLLAVDGHRHLHLRPPGAAHAPPRGAGRVS